MDENGMLADCPEYKSFYKHHNISTSGILVVEKEERTIANGEYINE